MLFHMPRFEVYISEPPAIVDVRVSPGGVSSLRRYICQEFEAADNDAAIKVAWHAWDEKFGADNRPDQPIVRVTRSALH